MSKLDTLWHLDDNDYLRSPAGTKVARLDQEGLWLFDKMLKTALPFTLVDWALLTGSPTKKAGSEPAGLDTSQDG